MSGSPTKTLRQGVQTASILSRRATLIAMARRLTPSLANRLFPVEFDPRLREIERPGHFLVAAAGRQEVQDVASAHAQQVVVPLDPQVAGHAALPDRFAHRTRQRADHAPQEFGCIGAEPAEPEPPDHQPHHGGEVGVRIGEGLRHLVRTGERGSRLQRRFLRA